MQTIYDVLYKIVFHYTKSIFLLFKFLLAALLGRKASFYDHYYFEIFGLRGLFYEIACLLNPSWRLWSDLNLETPFFDAFRRLKEGDVVIDLGACIGAYTVYAAKKLGAQGKVIAVEPNPGNFSILKRRCSKLSNTVLVNAAISGENGVRDLYVSDYIGSHSLYKRKNNDRGKQIKVHTTTLDTLVRTMNLTSVNLLKLDIECAEFEALSSAAYALSITKSIIVSIHRASEMKTLSKVLKERGFNVVFWPHLNILYGNKYS